MSKITEDGRFKLTFVVAEQCLLRDFLKQHQLSKRTITATKYNGGQLLVNGVERTVRHKLLANDLVTVIFPAERTSDGLRPEYGKLTVLYEDEAVLMIDKPPGQSTIPSHDHPTGTVANDVAGKLLKEGIPATVHVVTRLDRDTSGVICIAKNRHIHHLLSEQMIATGFYRQYSAFVEGHVNQKRIVIEAPIGRKEDSIIERRVREDGQYARTDVEIVKHFTVNGFKYSQVNLVLHTGRTHQIRVHMQSIGHPLIGDDLYGGSHALLNRQALHCSKLSFKHPLTGESMECESKMPKDMSFLSIDEDNQRRT